MRGQTGPRDDPLTLRYLQTLLESLHKMDAGPVRQELAFVLLFAHTDYVARTDDASLVETTARLVDTTSDPIEKAAIVQSLAGLLHRQADGCRERFAKHADPLVRAAVVPLLKIEALAAFMRDPDPRLRRSAAIGIQYYSEHHPRGRSPVHVRFKTVLINIAEETDPLAMDARVRAARSINGKHGMARLNRALKRAPKAIRNLAKKQIVLPKPEMRSPTLQYDDPITKRYIMALWKAWRDEPEGMDRRKLLLRHHSAHSGYVRRTHDRGMIESVAQAIERNEYESERLLMVLLYARLDTASIDTLIKWAENASEGLRADAAIALGKVNGEEMPRAQRVIATLLQDSSPSVRQRAANAIRMDAVEQLLEALSNETDFITALAQVKAILARDPRRGRKRIKKLRAHARQPQRELIDRVFAFQKYMK